MSPKRFGYSDTVSLGQQFLLDLIAPPVLACLWWLGSRGWAQQVQGGQVSDQTRNRQKVEFVIVLSCLYLLMFGTTLYLHFTQ
jgi:hypothetical protein